MENEPNNIPTYLLRMSGFTISCLFVTKPHYKMCILFGISSLMGVLSARIMEREHLLVMTTMCVHFQTVVLLLLLYILWRCFLLVVVFALLNLKSRVSVCVVTEHDAGSKKQIKRPH